MTTVSNFVFAPPNMGAPGEKKNYVFVDEHNRHRRLKVVRACDGCRRRKIKCDSATTNQWPCAACVRLKLTCIPPAAGHERNLSTGTSKTGTQGIMEFDNSDASADEDFVQPQSSTLAWDMQNTESGSVNPAFTSTMGPFGNTPPYSHLNGQDLNFADMSQLPIANAQTAFNDPNAFAYTEDTPQRSNSTWSGDPQYSAAELSEILGELKINESGVPPYIAQQKKVLATGPAYEEHEAKLPQFTTQAGASVRIPPELMPSDEQCMQYLNIYFNEIHPYVPVISKSYFFQQWNNNRRSISPLILEAIFACAGRMSEDAAQGAQWLALASSHEDCFMDVPRLSTVQAMMILVKARESAPKRGYYYRSWITIKKLVTMAHDLELQDHYELHKNGQTCGSDATECLIKTRVWQTLFVLETMIGAPQGRSDMGVDPDSIDNNVPSPSPEIDDYDHQISRQWTYMVRKVLYVRKMHDLKGKIKEVATANWANHPEFTAMDETMNKWLETLPQDLQASFFDDRSPPWIPSHFVGNLHTYFHLTMIMCHRPQLMHSASYADDSWKKHMRICYDSSKKMCRLQEAILDTYGISGLLCMQRGINYVIYAVLTCTMVHLVAITTPEAEFNRDAKEYFTRHMRILETCTSAWPQADMQKQIDALRDAFSADTSKPFELKSSFPHGSPLAGLTSPPMEGQFSLPKITRNGSQGQLEITHSLPFQPGPMTPPMTASLDGTHDGSLGLSGSIASSQSTAIRDAAASWNPTPIFEGWNAAFGEHSASMADVNATLPGQSPPFFSPNMSLHHPLTPTHQSTFGPSISMTGGPNGLPRSRINSTPNIQVNHHFGASNTGSLAGNLNASPSSSGATATSNLAPDQPSFMTSNMWRESIASTYDRAALKRAWDQTGSNTFAVDSLQVKRQR